MTDLPNKSLIISPTTTEAQFQSGLGDLYDYIAQLVSGCPPEAYELSSNTITPNTSFIKVETEGFIATDILSNILISSLGAKVIFIKGNSSTRVVTLAHQGGGTGQLYFNDGQDKVLDNENKIVAMYYETSSNTWRELWRNWGVYSSGTSDRTQISQTLGLGTVANYFTGTASNNIPLNSDLGDLAFEAALTDGDQIAHEILKNNHVLDGVITLLKFKSASPNSLWTYDFAGEPAPLQFTGNASHFLRGDMTFNPIPAGPGGLTKYQGNMTIGANGFTGGTTTWVADYDKIVLAIIANSYVPAFGWGAASCTLSLAIAGTTVALDSHTSLTPNATHFLYVQSVVKAGQTFTVDWTGKHSEGPECFVFWRDLLV